MNVKDLIPVISLTCLCGDLIIVAVNSNVAICVEAMGCLLHQYVRVHCPMPY